MSKKQKIIDELSFEKSKFTANMTDKEKKEADIYFEEVIEEILPVLENLEKITGNKKLLDNFSETFKSEIKEQQWLEKLSKTFFEMKT